MVISGNEWQIDYKMIGNSIRVQRKMLSLTQAQLAEKTGLSVSYIGHVERGTRIASLATIVMIAKTLQLPISALLDSPSQLPAGDSSNDDIRTQLILLLSQALSLLKVNQNE